MRVCDWIANFVYDQGIRNIHGLTGGGAMGLNDGFIKHEGLNYIAYHHEQGAGHAAIGESKFTGIPSVVNPTTGCGGTNCITSVLNAWQDSVPVIFISGNVKLVDCSRWINQNKNVKIRKFGVQEHDIIETVKTITKKAFFVTKTEDIASVLQEAFYITQSDRPGPVWIDIPADIQSAEMPLDYKTFKFKDSANNVDTFREDVLFLIHTSERPVVLAGYGIRQSKQIDQFINFITKFHIPYVSTYGARDYLPFDHNLNIGAVGIKGTRAGNFVMQNADLILVLGSSLNSSVVGYDSSQFNPLAKKIVIDIDKNELDKDLFNIDLKLNVSLETFFEVMV